MSRAKVCACGHEERWHLKSARDAKAARGACNYGLGDDALDLARELVTPDLSRSAVRASPLLFPKGDA